MDNALSLLSQFPENKAQIKTFVGSFVDAAKNGYNEPLEVLKKIKILEEITKGVKAQLNDFFEDESDKYHEKTIERYGCEFQKRETPKYDFSVCNDMEYEKALSDISDAKERLKKREAFLKSLTGEVANVNTGEIIKLPVKTTQTTIAVIIK